MSSFLRQTIDEKNLYFLLLESVFFFLFFLLFSLIVCLRKEPTVVSKRHRFKHRLSEVLYLCQSSLVFLFWDYRRITFASPPVYKPMATPTSFSARVYTHPCISPRAYTWIWTPHCAIVDFSPLTCFVMTLIDIGPLFALFLHFREPYRCLAFIFRVFPAPVSFSSHVWKIVTAIILSLCESPSVYKPSKSSKWACTVCWSPGLANGILRYMYGIQCDDAPDTFWSRDLRIMGTAGLGTSTLQYGEYVSSHYCQPSHSVDRESWVTCTCQNGFHWILDSVCIQPGAVKLKSCIHPVTSENQFHCTGYHSLLQSSGFYNVLRVCWYQWMNY